MSSLCPALASFVMVFGKLLFGFILGNIASTLANAEIKRVKYEEKLGAVQVCDIDITPKYGSSQLAFFSLVILFKWSMHLA